MRHIRIFCITFGNNRRFWAKEVIFLIPSQPGWRSPAKAMYVYKISIYINRLKSNIFLGYRPIFIRPDNAQEGVFIFTIYKINLWKRFVNVKKLISILFMAKVFAIIAVEIHIRGTRLYAWSWTR